MTAGKTKTDPAELRMDAGEFDRIMGRALRVKPPERATERPKAKRPAKAKGGKRSQ